MKKIGLYLDSILTGGTFQYNLSILEAVQSLPTKQFETTIAYTSDLWHDYLKNNQIYATRIKRTYLSRLWFQVRTPLWFWRNFSNYINSFTKSFVKENCNLWIFPSQDIWAYSLPVPSLSVVHDLMHRYERHFPEAGSKKEFIFREKHYARTCDKSSGILVDSELGKQQLVESYSINRSKVHVLPFIPPKYIYNNNSIDFNYKLPSKYIFYPAQFWEHKNHKSLVVAASQLVARIPDLKMVFVGAPNNGYDKLVKLIEKLDLQSTFIFLEHIPDEHMSHLYKNARALVMPTFFGPTNIPPLEAFVTGCPVAASNIYAMPEQIGDAGLFFDPKSSQEIADIIYKLWTDDTLINELRTKGTAKSKQWGQKQFNQRFMDIINSIV